MNLIETTQILGNRGGPRISDGLLRWAPDRREGVWNAPQVTEVPG